MPMKYLCIDSGGYKTHLTKGKLYNGEWSESMSRVEIHCDNGSKFYFYQRRFKKITTKDYIKLCE